MTTAELNELEGNKDDLEGTVDGIKVDWVVIDGELRIVKK